jgi:hypothetical protein
MRKVLFGLVAVAMLGLACFAPLSQASASPFHFGFYGGHHGHGHGHGFHGYYPSYGHYDYHAPSLQWHGNHYDYVPGHYDYHSGPHYHW